jgi:hypothetical protein
MKKEPIITERKPESESAFARTPLAYVIGSIAVLIPCFWQSRLQAGDLSSHIYNAWLAQLIERGQAPGLSLESQTTNLLFDWMLSAGFRAFGPETAQRIAVSIAVLIFVWGAFAFVSVVAKRRAWNMLPWIGILAYGWVFHMGFFNFYLSLGLCFGALALAWDWNTRRLAGAAALIAVAYVAHGLPVAWAAGVTAYMWIARRVGPSHQMKLLGATLFAIAVLRLVLSSMMPTRWWLSQLTLVTGLDQLWVFDSKYLLTAVAALLIWIAMLVRLQGVWQSVLIQVCVLTAAGIVILPTRLDIPLYKHALVYVAERMSLALAICICALMAGTRTKAYDRYATVAIVGLFLILLYRDESRLNSFEDQMSVQVAQLPPFQKVISGIVEQGGLRVNAVAHMIDRVCVGRCYSYANYEPATAQFRVRVNAPNPIVASTYPESADLQNGVYVIKESDLPLYQLLVDESGRILSRIPPAGAPCGVSSVALF